MAEFADGRQGVMAGLVPAIHGALAARLAAKTRLRKPRKRLSAAKPKTAPSVRLRRRKPLSRWSNATGALVNLKPRLNHSWGDFNLNLGRASRRRGVDGRDKPGHDGNGSTKA
jgi:hypothetical protein